MPTEAEVRAWRATAVFRLRPDQWNVSAPERVLARAVPEMADMLVEAAALLEWTDDGGQHCDSWREAVAKWVRQWRGEATDAAD